MLIFLFVLALLAFGGHWGYIVLCGGFRPIHLLVQVLVLLLLYRVGRKLIDHYL
jgi:hypothetical protein